MTKYCTGALLRVVEWNVYHKTLNRRAVSTVSTSRRRFNMQRCGKGQRSGRNNLLEVRFIGLSDTYGLTVMKYSHFVHWWRQEMVQGRCILICVDQVVYSLLGCTELSYYIETQVLIYCPFSPDRFVTRGTSVLSYCHTVSWKNIIVLGFTHDWFLHVGQACFQTIFGPRLRWENLTYRGPWQCKPYVRST